MTECDVCETNYFTTDSNIRTSYCDAYGECYKHADCEMYVSERVSERVNA